MYKELLNGPVSEAEKNQTNYWDEIDLLHKSVESREGNEKFVFYDGPPTANGKPGLHHVISRALKDSICRYKTMQGYVVRRKAGWDTHGLPVEIEVEKKLNLSNKQDIEKYGMEKFNKQCRESVFEYESIWREQTRRMAYLVDLDNPYITLEDNYIESVWWILDKFYKEGYVYEGHKILPYCSRCGTGLASHEVAQGYEEKKTETVTVKFKRKDADEYFLVWTTTPWTLAANVAITVNPKETYLKVKQDGEVYYVVKSLAGAVLGEDYEVLEEMPGSALEGVEYEQIMPFVEVSKKAFFVTLGDYVTTEDGTGLVHTAPAFGEDDYKLGQRYDLPVPQPVSEEGKYTTTPWEGMFVMDADVEIIKWLRENGKLYRKQRIEHNYPHCWRCKTPLLYYAKPSWYIEITKLKDKLIENNKGVNWYPDYVGEKRFGNWLENLNDWAISRNRYWGTPLNIWRCSCGHTDTVGSKAELLERATEKFDSIELHRPYVDNVKLSCDKCGGEMKRVEEVVDVWFDSGAMPFAQHHYPFENKENFDDLFPADYICEGIDQTRGWFYSLLAISTFVTGKSPYKNVLVNDLLLDKDGKKMSKSKGNVLDAFELFDKYGADAVRWYLYYVSPAWSPTKFDEAGLREVVSKFFNTYKNVYNLFTLYANNDGINANDFYVIPEKRSELDRWILSRLNSLVKNVNDDFDQFDLTKATRKIQDFVNEDLSNWYIRRSRRRYWKSELDTDKKSVYTTTFEVLLTVSKLAAPFAPFITEEIYRNLTGEESVHLAEYPACDESLIDELLEERMEVTRNAVGLGRAARESVKIKVRQPLSKVLLDGKFEEMLGSLKDVIKEELNVKDVEFISDVSEYMDYKLKPNFRVLGPLLGKNMGAFGKALSALNPFEVINKLDAGEKVSLEFAGETFEAEAEHIDYQVLQKEGFTVETENNLFVILDNTLTEELVEEGYAREFVSKVQQMRKNNGFDVIDNIKIFYSSTPEFSKGVEAHREFIMKETLALELLSLETEGEKMNLNGHDVEVMIERV